MLSFSKYLLHIAVMQYRNVVKCQVLLLRRLFQTPIPYILCVPEAVPGYRISARGALKKPFSVSEKCGTERQTAVSEKNPHIYPL